MHNQDSKMDFFLITPRHINFLPQSQNTKCGSYKLRCQTQRLSKQKKNTRNSLVKRKKKVNYCKINKENGTRKFLFFKKINGNGLFFFCFFFSRFKRFIVLFGVMHTIYRRYTINDRLFTLLSIFFLL